MLKIVTVVLALATTAYAAEISSSYASLEKNSMFKPESIETHAMKEVTSEMAHPIYRAEEIKSQGRARVEPVRPVGPVIKHAGMLSDQPAASTEINRVDEGGILGNGYIPNTGDVAYPDIPYAPGYFYDAAYSSPNNYDSYGMNPYLMEPDTSAFGLLWSQVPDGRTLVNYVGRTILWVFNSVFVLLLGSLLTVGVCSYTNLCTIAFHGVGPIHEEMRALMSPERLDKISHAADFVKTAIDKYQKIQKVADEMPSMRKRRSSFKY
ncbi:unnamed protein product [Arctia plantaginis]|uniref:Uncharacterized protein n=1 Tax=Arctia plantaginis TaxID=874455 RepID=A0A8S0ZR77_ARCPL|nr:unnamed protein product [Arctia plantaginis]